MVTGNRVSSSLRLMVDDCKGLRSFAGVRHNATAVQVSQFVGGINAITSTPAVRSLLTVRAELAEGAGS